MIELLRDLVNIDSGSYDKAGVDAVGRVTLDLQNSEGRRFSFTNASRSVAMSTARAVVAGVQYFVNAERAFLTLHNARRAAAATSRPIEAIVVGLEKKTGSRQLPRWLTWWGKPGTTTRVIRAMPALLSAQG